MCCSVRHAPEQRTVVGKQTWSVSLGCICVSVRKATISLLEGRNVYQTRGWYYQPPVARMATALPYQTHTATKIWVCKPLILQIWSVCTLKFVSDPDFVKLLFYEGTSIVILHPTRGAIPWHQHFQKQGCTSVWMLKCFALLGQLLSIIFVSIYLQDCKMIVAHLPSQSLGKIWPEHRFTCNKKNHYMCITLRGRNHWDVWLSLHRRDWTNSVRLSS